MKRFNKAVLLCAVTLFAVTGMKAQLIYRSMFPVEDIALEMTEQLDYRLSLTTRQFDKVFYFYCDWIEESLDYMQYDGLFPMTEFQFDIMLNNGFSYFRDNDSFYRARERYFKSVLNNRQYRLWSAMESNRHSGINLYINIYPFGFPKLVRPSHDLIFHREPVAPYRRRDNYRPAPRPNRPAPAPAPGGHRGPDGPGQYGQPAQPARPERPANPAQPARPAQPEAPRGDNRGEAYRNNDNRRPDNGSGEVKAEQPKNNANKPSSEVRQPSSTNRNSSATRVNTPRGDNKPNASSSDNRSQNENRQTVKPSDNKKAQSTTKTETKRQTNATRSTSTRESNASRSSGNSSSRQSSGSSNSQSSSSHERR